MVNEVIGVTIKGIGDFSDVVSNVGSVQKALTKLKLPDKLGDSLNKNISNFMKEYDKYQKKIAEGIHTQGDQNTVSKSLNSMLNSYEKIIKDFGKLSEKDFKDIFNLDTGAFEKFHAEIKQIEADIKKIKLDPKNITGPIDEIKKLTSAGSLFGNGKGFDRLNKAFAANNLIEAKQAIKEIDTYLDRFGSKMKPEKLEAFTAAYNPLKQQVMDADAKAEGLFESLDRVNAEIAELGQKGAKEVKDFSDGLQNSYKEAEKLTDVLKRQHAEEFNFNRQAQDISRQIQQYFGLTQIIRKVGDIARDAFATVKELDKAMTETAVVTNFSVGDMWDMLPTYTAQANQLGSTIKDVYEAATLYYQQGLNTNQAMGLANETLKMARIAGLDAADATNMMTAALRGFNMEINQMSAQKVNDIYSELAAITASDTKEIGSAMERTASIANSANMDFATTSAFLAQMIETTREAPENLGTAMKTIVARFQEMKQDPTKLIDSEGVAMDANKVDKALKTIGVNLMNTKGEFRDLDDVFLDIASKWDSLSQGQQRYIATIAAGSRQQSRFIAMMSDYERTMELVEAANNSAGASQRQFEKTLDSMEAKLNMLKNAWDQFTMGLMNNQLIKFGVDRLTDGFTILNKFIDLIGKITPKPFEGLTKSILTLVTTIGLLKLGGRGANALSGGVLSWLGGEGFKGGFSAGWSRPGNKTQKNSIAALQGKADAAAYSAAVQNAMAKGGLTKAIAMAWKTKGQNFDFTNTFGAAFGQFSGERFAASWSTDIEAEITRVLNSVIDDAAKIGDKTGQEFKQHLLAQLKAGEISGEQLISSVQTNTGKDISNLGVNAKQLNEGAKAAENFGVKIGSAGDSLLRFGAVLQGTPLAPFGSMLSTVGMALSTFGSTINWVADTFMLGMGKVVAAEGTAVGITKLLGAGFKQLWLDMGPVGWVILGIIALAGVYKALDAAIVSNKEQLEAATDAAAAASEAYDSAKQETSELADSIDTIRETDSAFDGLVAGTAEFNEQLVTANEQIMALIDKYPMLNDSQYLSTDKNGLMHINEAGFKAVQEYQKQIQARASAMNLIQTADLNALENQQKAQQLRNSIKTNMSDDEQNRILRNADLLEQRAEAETKLAHLNAIRTSLVDKEIADQEKLASIYVDQYEAKKQAAEVEVDAMSKHDIRQAYADYHGYTYDKSTKKIKDVEGNEIDYDDAAIKDEVIEQTVMLDFEANASSLEGILYSLDREFSKTLKGTFENSSSFISDILSNNIETNEDLLQQVLDNPEQLNDFVEGLTSKEIAAVLGASETAVEQNVEGYKQELEDKLLSNAQNIIDTNAQANGELAAMLAQAQGKTANEVLISKNTQNGLIEQVRNFTSEQKNTLLSIGKILEESAGAEAMTTFISGLSDIYRNGSEELQTATQDWVDSVNWETATGRLKGYNEAINMTVENTDHLGKETVQQLNNLGQSLLDSKDEANLLGEAFEEFYNSTDFQDLAENMDKFVDSSGQLNAASVMDMAEECHSLNNLLDTGAISAGGVAAALNALGSSGDLVLSDLNSRVLELLSNFGQLDNIIASSHRNIENFDWGIDTGEAEDFVSDAAEKWNELYNNGEYGNPQLEAYAKWIMGEERYIELLASKHGDLEATMAEVSKSVDFYSEGFEKAWDKLAEGSWENVDFSDDLKDLGIKVSFDENGDWKFDPGKATTEQLQKWLQQALRIGPEMAQAMVEDWSNYSGDFRAERQKNDFEAGLDSYVEQRRGANGEVAITASELNAIVGATGQTEEEIRAAIANRANIDADQVKILENIDKNTGEYVTDGAILNKQLTNAVGAKGQNGWLSAYQAKDSAGHPMKNTIDIENAMAAAVERGYTEAQAKSMAYESYTNAEEQGKDYYYKGELLEAEQYKTFDQFAARLEEIDQNEQWTTIGQAMADGFLNRLEERDKSDESSNQNDKPKEPSTTNYPKGTTIPGVGFVPSGASEPSLYNNAYADGLAKNKEAGKAIVDAFTNLWKNRNPDVEDPKVQALQKSAEETGSVLDRLNSLLNTSVNDATGYNTETESTSTNQASENLTDGSESLAEAASQLTGGLESLGTAGESLNTAASNLTTAAAAIVTSSQNGGSNSGSGTVPGVPQTAQPNQSSVSGAIVIDNSAALTSLDEVYQKATETAAEVNKGATFVIKTPGLTNLSKAAKDAQKVTENAGSKDISLNTSLSGASSESIDTLKTSVKSFNTLGSHAVTLTTNLKGTSAASIETMIAAINAFHLKTDHIVTLKTIKETVDKHATGTHNHGSFSAPSFGSAASGYGQVGPKGKGGLTLTGELGYEIAWIPSENRSMILGANGPQMVDLPGDAVVWTHEQSKKILKQKAIPAGSHSTRHRNVDTPNGGSDDSVVSKTIKSSGKGVVKAAEEAAKQVGRVSVWWENIARMTEAAQRRQDKNQKAFEKYIKEMRATLKTTGKSLKTGGGGGDAYIKSIGKTSAYYKAQLKKVNTELHYLDKGKNWTSQKVLKQQYGRKNRDNVVQISYEGKNSNNKKATLNRFVNLAPYIKESNGTYIIDQKRLNNIDDKNKRKAVADAANKEIDERLSKKYTAQDNIDKAKEALEKMSEELYETFFAWESSLDAIWNITQKIEAIQSKLNRTDAVSNLLDAQLGSGLRQRDKGTIKKDLSLFKQRLQQQKQLIDDRQKAITLSKQEVTKAVSKSDEKAQIKDINDKLKADKAIRADKQNKKLEKEKKKLDSKKDSKRIKEINQQIKDNKKIIKKAGGLKKAQELVGKKGLNTTERMGLQANKKGLKDEVSVIEAAQKYAKIVKNKDGTVSIDFNSERFEKDKAKGRINADLGKGIEEYINNIKDASANLDETYQSLTEDVTTYYTDLSELKDQWVDYENQILQMTEESNEKELENLKKLSESVSKALNKLLDDVKKKLDEHRQQEDNRKTETDISKKQQRLAALRADTSGGHQVEIAQLEQEIAEAQQTYQRSLEDQLLEKLQNQADLAAEQREHQIELQEEILATIDNREEVNKLMLNPEAEGAKDRLRELYRESENYDKLGKAGQARVDEEFEQWYVGLVNNQKKQEDLTDAINNATEVLKLIDSAQDNSNKPQKSKGKGKGKEEGSGGGSKSENTNTFDAKKYGLETQYHTFLYNRGNKTNTGDASWGKLGKEGYLAQVKRGKALGYSEKQVALDLAKTDKLSWYQIIKAASAAGRSGSAIKKWYPDAKKDSTFRKAFDKVFKKGWDKYATGGLATETGPAWLDGTPSKPELVLNAHDTKNFIALKDVLAKAMDGMGDTSNTYGDIMYEINIHVDKIEKDYDVDRVVDKVKKEIVKGAGYRNVTQVRNLK